LLCRSRVRFLVDLPAEHTLAEVVQMQNGVCAGCRQDLSAASKFKVRVPSSVAGCYFFIISTAGFRQIWDGVELKAMLAVLTFLIRNPESTPNWGRRSKCWWFCDPSPKQSLIMAS